MQGGGWWKDGSDRNAKENTQSTDGGYIYTYMSIFVYSNTVFVYIECQRFLWKIIGTPCICVYVHPMGDLWLM